MSAQLYRKAVDGEGGAILVRNWMVPVFDVAPIAWRRFVDEMPRRFEAVWVWSSAARSPELLSSGWNYEHVPVDHTHWAYVPTPDGPTFPNA